MKKLKGWEGKPMTKLEDAAHEFLENYDQPLRIRDGIHKRQMELFAAAFAADQLKAKDAEITRLTAERDEAVRERDELRCGARAGLLKHMIAGDVGRFVDQMRQCLQSMPDNKNRERASKLVSDLMQKSLVETESAEAQLKQIRELIVRERDCHETYTVPWITLDDLLRALDAMETK